jgi:SAM-dependent methyltransferase
MSDRVEIPPLFLSSRPCAEDASYHARVIAEKGIYEDCVNVHNLPGIFHYWSDRYVRPKLEPFGFSSPAGLFKKYLAEQCERRNNCALRFVSLGSGNCDLEIELALHLRAKGHVDFVIDCVDLNSTMLERGRIAAAKDGVVDHLYLVEADFNQWNPTHEYDAVIANQALHHVLNLEGLFTQIKSSLKPHGLFVISDIIGRNGHLRWPEALDIVREFWRKLPPSYRFNRQLERYEELFDDWDCSIGSFEGIRSQDILALLLEHFHFRLFVGYANVIDPFVDRSFGHNFDAAAPWDRAFIDQVHQRDEIEIAAGRIKPTHMLAVAGNTPGTQMLFHEPLTPEFCLHSPDAAVQRTVHLNVENGPEGAYAWHTWPHSAQRELEIACQRLANSENRLKRLEKQLEEHAARAEQLNKEFQERTAWALRLEKDLEDRTALANRLNTEFEDRTAWALRLNRQLDELNRELKQLALARRLNWHLRRICAGFAGPQKNG